MFESLRKRQDELGIQRTISRTNDRWKKMAPTKNDIITPKATHTGTITQSDADDNGLAVDPSVPGSELEAKDVSNVVHWMVYE